MDEMSLFVNAPNDAKGSKKGAHVWKRAKSQRHQYSPVLSGEPTLADPTQPSSPRISDIPLVFASDPV